ncbi:MAG: nucleotidyltransferase family protein [Armatimonadetes bacterium]|nr:nucleotidyltransferase family protein [Armatimonadota bacterium]
MPSPIASPLEQTKWDKWAQALATRYDADTELALLSGSVSDWSVCVKELHERRLSGAVWTTFRDQGLQRLLPQSVQQSFSHEWSRAVRMNSESHAPVSRLAALLDNERIPWVLLKIPSASDFLYFPEPADYVATSVVLTKPESYNRTLKLLAKNQWELREDMPPEYTALGSATLTHISHGAAQVRVLCHLWSPLARPSEEVLWESLEKADLDERSVQLLGSADRALWSAVGSVFDRRLHETWQLLDIALALGRLDREGWLLLLDHAQRMDVLPEASMAIQACAHRTDLRPPPGVSDFIAQAMPKGRRAQIPSLMFREDASTTDLTLARISLLHTRSERRHYCHFAKSPPYGWREEHRKYEPDDLLCEKPFKGFWGALRHILCGWW